MDMGCLDTSATQPCQLRIFVRKTECQDMDPA